MPFYGQNFTQKNEKLGKIIKFRHYFAIVAAYKVYYVYFLLPYLCK